MIDFLETNNDIYFNNIDFSGISDIAESVKQRLKIRLTRFYGEWFLDIDKGVQYFEVIKVKNPNIEVINSLLKTECLKEDRVIEVLNWESSIDIENRIFEILPTTLLKIDTGETIEISGAL